MKNLCKLKCPKIPVIRKCCFCIPTYVGIAVFGYADLTLALVAFPMLMYEMVDELTSDKPHEGMHYSDPAIHLPVIVTAALADIVLTVVLLIGAHRVSQRTLLNRNGLLQRQASVLKYEDPAIHLPVIVTAALADIVRTVVILIGEDKKNKLMLKIYFYFATVSQLITLLADLPFFDYTEYKKNVLYIFFVGLNIYLLFLVHNVVYVREESREIQYIAYEQHRTSV